jgi:hypothetical protein
MSPTRREFLAGTTLVTLASTWLGGVRGVLAQTATMLLNYQGRLANLSGQARNGTFDMAFRIVDAGGSSLGWSESHAGVLVSNGFFSVTLGSGTPLTQALFLGPPVDAFGPVRFLEVSVGGETLSPNIRLASAAWAIVAPAGPTARTERAPTGPTGDGTGRRDRPTGPTDLRPRAKASAIRPQGFRAACKAQDSGRAGRPPPRVNRFSARRRIVPTLAAAQLLSAQAARLVVPSNNGATFPKIVRDPRVRGAGAGRCRDAGRALGATCPRCEGSRRADHDDELPNVTRSRDDRVGLPRD